MPFADAIHPATSMLSEFFGSDSAAAGQYLAHGCVSSGSYLSEPRRVARPDGLRAKIVADKALPRARHFFPISVIRDQLRHRSSSVPDVRLGPYLIGPERIALFGDADQLVIHKACGAFARELATAGII